MRTRFGVVVFAIALVVLAGAAAVRGKGDATIARAPAFNGAELGAPAGHVTAL